MRFVHTLLPFFVLIVNELYLIHAQYILFVHCQARESYDPTMQWDRGVLSFQSFEYKPVEVKVAVTGYGQSDKTHIKEMVKKLLRVEKEIKLDDEYDAIAVGLTHLAVYRQNKMGD